MAPVLHDDEAEEGQVLLRVGPFHPLDFSVVHRFRQVATTQSYHSVSAFSISARQGGKNGLAELECLFRSLVDRTDRVVKNSTLFIGNDIFCKFCKNFNLG